MGFRGVLFLNLLILSFITGCGGGEKGVESENKVTSVESVKPELPVEKFVVKGCLNLEHLSRYLEQPGFNFPGRVSNYDYSSDRFETELLVRNFGYREIQFRNLPFLKNVKQTDCQSVTAETAYGRVQYYQVVSSSEDEISIERTSDPEGEALEEAYVEAYNIESAFKSLNFKVVSPTQLKVGIDVEAQRFGCSQKNTFEFKKTSVYRWAETRENLPQSETLSQVNFNKIINLVPSQVEREIRARRPIPEPETLEEPPTTTAQPSQVVMPSEGELALSLDEIKRISLLLPVKQLDLRCN